MLIIHHVWAGLGRWWFRRGTWSFRPATTTTSWKSHPPVVFLSQSGVHQSATSPKGGKSHQKGGLLKRSRDGGVHPRVSMSKRGTCSHPIFDHSRSPAMHSRKRESELSGWLGGVQGARQTLRTLIWSRFDGENERRRRRKAVSAFWSMF